MKKRFKYRSENEKFFLDYFPDRIFKKLNKSEREHYREYRRYHRQSLIPMKGLRVIRIRLKTKKEDY